MERIARICAMEERMERANAALAAGEPSVAKDDVLALSAYYSGGQWLADYEADERGELPRDLKRGVLSQDGLYDLLEAWNTVKDEGEGL